MTTRLDQYTWTMARLPNRTAWKAKSVTWPSWLSWRKLKKWPGGSSWKVLTVLWKSILLDLNRTKHNINEYLNVHSFTKARENFFTCRFNEVVNISHLPICTGSYMYIETSSPRQLGDNAKLNSPKLKFNGNMCLKFYYHMYGADIGTLNVNINGNNVFNASGDKGNKWLMAAIDVNLSGQYAVRETIMATVRCLVYCNCNDFVSFSTVLAGHSTWYFFFSFNLIKHIYLIITTLTWLKLMLQYITYNLHHIATLLTFLTI